MLASGCGLMHGWGGVESGVLGNLGWARVESNQSECMIVAGGNTSSQRKFQWPEEVKDRECPLHPSSFILLSHLPTSHFFAAATTLRLWLEALGSWRGRAWFGACEFADFDSKK